jgi:hypothetical protein
MKHLVTVQLETNHANSDGVAWYAYFSEKPTGEDLEFVFDYPDKIVDTALDWDFEEVGFEAVEIPNLLSKHAGLHRYYVADAC